MTFLCEFCNSELNSKSSLNQHIKNAKYCLKIRGEENNSGFQCSFCSKNYSTKQALDIHLKKCLKYSEHLKSLELYQDINQKKDEQIKQLQSLVERLANKPTTVNNYNTQLNLIQSVNLEEEHINQVCEDFLSLQDISNGIRGYNNFINRGFLKDEKGNFTAWCSDYSRKIIKYKNENDEIIRDPSGYNLINKTLPIMIRHGKEAYKKFENTYYKKNKEGELTLKSPEEVKREYNKEYYADYTPTESDIETEDGEIYVSINKVREKAYKKVSKIVSEINEMRKKYDPELVEDYLQNIINGLNDIMSIYDDISNFSNKLCLSLPDKPIISKMEMED